MSKISEKFKSLQEEGRKALIPYITAGDPSFEATEEMIYSLEEGGADIIELGIPYSDPLADGPVLQKSAGRALSGGVKIRGIFALVEKVRKNTQIPLVFLTYYNCIYNYGIENFINDCNNTGVNGIIMPDLPPEESKCYKEKAHRRDIDTIYLLAPTSANERIKIVAASTSGFIYCVSLTATTGARDSLSSGLKDFISRVRKETELPLCVGFGISSPQQAKEVVSFADGVIVGSALVEQLEGLSQIDSFKNTARSYIQSIRKAMDDLE